jgi:hypothetical protein
VGVEDPPKSLEEIKNILIKQNNEIFDNKSDFEVISAVKIEPKNRNCYHNIIIETNGRLYNKIMNVDNPRINFDWNRCKVFDAINIKRCFKCCSYKHLANECQSESKCFICAGAHFSSECDKKIEKCINCVNRNNLMQTNIDTSHNALSLNCPIYNKILKNRKRNINYE